MQAEVENDNLFTSVEAEISAEVRFCFNVPNMIRGFTSLCCHRPINNAGSKTPNHSGLGTKNKMIRVQSGDL